MPASRPYATVGDLKQATRAKLAAGLAQSANMPKHLIGRVSGTLSGLVTVGFRILAQYKRGEGGVVHRPGPNSFDIPDEITPSDSTTL